MCKFEYTAAYVFFHTPINRELGKITYMILALKIFSVIVTTALGIMSLLYNFKGEDGAVTKVGKLIIWVMLSAFILSVITTIVESNDSKNEAQEQLERTTRVLHEFNRTQSPITKVELTYWLHLPDDNNEVKEYKAYIDKEIKGNIEDILSIPSRSELDAASIDVNGEPLNIHIKPESRYWPHVQKGLSSVARFYTFSIYMKREKVEPSKFDSTISVAPQMSDFVAMGLLPENIIDYDYSSKGLYVFGTQKFDPKLWRMNGTVSSLPDLNGVQIFLVPNSSSDYKLPERYAKLTSENNKKLSRGIEVKTIRLSFSEGHEIWIDGSHIKKTGYLGGYPMFSVTLPKESHELSKLQLPKTLNKPTLSNGDKTVTGV